ncbi:hypothetical protein HU200_012608 [Digitaria exilis]|uniref:DUF4378 domain-containing protein n=1 Tax=Digitaria exilis TaxID=1010633 RepID=A0A835FDX1_9POAL|nr:hypothetical protein HU200_012608 [Digitaria exilis]
MGRTKQSSSSSSFRYARRRTSSAPATPRPEPAEDSPPIGCMSMVHYLIFAPGAGCVGRPPTGSSNVAIVTPHDSIIHSPRRRDGDKKSSGFDAPRNSLDLDTDNPNNIQIGVQIEPVFDALARTSMRRHKPTAPSSEAETPRTPSLVARLMGIDGLPDQASPSPAARHKKPSSTKKHHHATVASAAAADDDKENHYCSSAPSPASCNKEKKKRVIPESMNRREPLRSLSCNVTTAGELARSLPETPRASTSARASWDGARLSLQALKENVLDRAAQYMSMPSSPTSAGGGKNRSFTSRRRRDEKEREKVAKEHAREILRQAKENVASRKKASSKQMSTSNKSSSPATDKENVAPAASVEEKVVVVVQPGKPKSQGTENPASSQKSLRVPLAPRQQQQQHPPPQRAKPSRPPPPPPPLDPPPPPPPTRARRPDGCERFTTRVKKPSVNAGQGQPLAPASSSSPAMAAPPPAPTSSSPSVQIGNKQSPISPATVPLEEDPEYGYVRSVLERGGYMRRSPPAPPPRRPCHSVSSPVDPIVFHLLELDLPADEASAEAVRLGPLRHRWNRKLLFHLTQELLADLAESDTPAAMAVAAAPAMTGVPLLRSVWRKVRSFPAADCRVVGDIDALVAADFESSRSQQRMVSHPGAVEEAAAVAEEVAARVMEALIGECVAESFSLSTVPGGLTRSSSSSSRAQAR